MPSQRQRIGPPHPSAKMQRAASRVSASSSMNAPPGLGRPATDPESSEARSVDAPRERLERRRVSRTHWRTHRRGGSAGPREPGRSVVAMPALGLPPTSPSSGFLYQEIFGAYLVTYFLSVYFMAAIIGAAAIRLQGQRPYVLDGIAAANASFFQILLWSFLAATVGVLLRFTSIRSDAGGRFVSRVLGYGWPIATLFVLPTMVLEGVGPVKSFRRSRALLRERWGAHQSGVLGTGLVFLLLFTVGLVPFVWGIVGEPGSLTWPVAAVLYWLLLAALWSVVPGILVTTLYHYATDSEAAFGFSWQALNHPWIR